MTELRGGGIDGKRLWIRTPDDRWIPAPTGAGEDPVVRSVNVWDGNKWLVVSDPEPFYTAANTHLQMPSLELRAPGRYWTSGTNNPMYTSPYANARPWTSSMHEDWVRLYHLAPRVDPSWRTVQLYDFYPTSEVSAGDEPDYRVPFYPRGASYRSDVTRTRISSTTTNLETINSFKSTANFDAGTGDFSDNWCSAFVRRSSPDGSDLPIFTPKPDDVLGVDTFQSSLIDLKAIRRRLATDFAERDPHFNRQYDSINLMQVKRVIVWLTVTVLAYVSGNGVSAANLSGGWCKINVHYGTPSTLISDWSTRNLVGGPYDVQRPNSTTSSIGTTLFSQTAADWTVGENTYYIPYRPGFKEFKAEGGGNVFHSFENPGENNIAFFVDTAPPAIPGGDAITHCSMQVSVRLRSASVHYALPGKDVPHVYWYPEANGYGGEFYGELS